MRNVCANSEIRKIHVIFTNIIHNYVKVIDLLTSEVKGSELYMIQGTKVVKSNNQACFYYSS